MSDISKETTGSEGLVQADANADASTQKVTNAPVDRVIGVTFACGPGRSVFIGKYLNGDGFRLTFKNIETAISLCISEEALRAIVENGGFIIDELGTKNESVAWVQVGDQPWPHGERTSGPSDSADCLNQTTSTSARGEDRSHEGK